jgi:hypothetical protein
MIMMDGGDGGSTQHAINTYGGIGQQHQVSANDYTIAMNSGSNLAPVIKGGADLSPAKCGGGIITDVAVPAAFVFARNAMTNRRLPGFPRVSGRRSRRFRRRSGRRRR